MVLSRLWRSTSRLSQFGCSRFSTGRSGARRLWWGLGAGGGVTLLPLLVIFGSVAQAQVMECSSANSDGSFTVPEEWELTPEGVGDNSNFRLLFVTSTTLPPESSDISVYNTYVQNRAKAGHAAISDSCGNLFKVVGSTATVNARVNTDTEASDTDAAIYWLNGVKVADDYADFYDGSWDNIGSNGKPIKNEYGQTNSNRIGSRVISIAATGTRNNGTSGPNTLGSGSVYAARSDLANPLESGAWNAGTYRQYYGLSPIFHVPADTTAPQVLSIVRYEPGGSPTAADSLTWRVTFSEAVQNVDMTDFQVSGTTASVTVSAVPDTTAYDVTASGGNLAGLNGTVTLSFATNQDIQDASSNSNLLSNTTPTGANNNSFVLDNNPPPAASRRDYAFLTNYDNTLERSEGAAGRSHFAVTRVRVPSADDDLATFQQIPNPWGFRLCLGGTATLGADYQVFTRHKQLPFDNDNCSPANSRDDGTGLAAGQDRAHFYIKVIDDAHEDSGETIVVRLDGAVGTSLYDFDSSFVGSPDGHSDAVRQRCARGGPCPTDKLIFTILNHDGPPPPQGPYAQLITKMYGWRNDPKWKSYKAHTDRWDRALLAFGEDVEDASLTPMAAEQAQVFADRGWKRWVEVAKALHQIEAAHLSPPGSPLRAVLSAPSGHVDEDGGRKTLNIALGRALKQGEALSIPLAFGGTATLADDYTLAAPGTIPKGVSYANLSSTDPATPPTVTFTGPSAQSATLVLTTNVDSIDEGTGETVTVATGTLAATGLDDGALGKGAAAFSILEPPLTVAVATAVSSLTEGNEAAFTLTASKAPAADLTVNLMVSDAPGSDFLATASEGSHTLTLEQGKTQAPFSLATVNDSTHEANGPVTVAVTKGDGYRVASSPDDTASVTVADDDAAPAVPEFTIGDVTANEDDRFMWFTVTLSMASNRTLQVSYRTRESNPVSARANSDFLQVSFGTLTFSPGETSKRFWVYIFNDSHDEGSETFQAVLSSPTGGAVITDGVAVGTILNDDPLPAAWHLRFGRTVSHQVVDALQDRFSSPAPLETGLQLALAGEDFTSDTPLAENQGLLSKALGFENVSHQLLVEGSSFSFAPQGEAGPQFALWGQGALSSFSGQEEEVSLDGDVTTLLLGADWSAGRWLAGAALSHSWANGSYDGEDDADGEISTSLTGLFPYGRYVLSPRLNLWATAGYGWGALSLKPDGNGEEYKPDTTMTMVALGMDGLLLDGGSEGVSLNATADLLSLNATSDKVEGLESSEGNVSRFRLGLEATRPFPFANGSSLLPSMEVGIRQDGGDAETGFGMDLGAGIAWKDPQRGISAELKGRTLLSHAEEDFQDQGLALSFSWDPSPSNRGPSLSMGHAMGVVESGGLDALLHPTTFEQMDGTTSNGQRFEAELAYGFPVHNDRLTFTPAMAMALSPTTRTYGLLWSVAPYAQQLQGEPWEVSLQGQRQEPISTTSPVEHSLKLNFSSSF